MHILSGAARLPEPDLADLFVSSPAEKIPAPYTGASDELDFNCGSGFPATATFGIY